MTDRISLRQLDYFVAAADAGTMTGAAQRLRVSQSAVSVAIAELERQLGTQLVLRRKAKGLMLTAAGRRLLPDARALLAHSDELAAGVHEVGQAPAGRLVVGCFTTIAPFLLPRLMEEFSCAHPEVVLDFVEGSSVELREFLLEGRCELAVLYDVDISAGLDYDVLFAARPHVLLPAAHPLALQRSVRLAHLSGRDMILLDLPPSAQYFREVLALAGVQPTVRHRTVSFEMVRSLVARGLGYSLLIQHPVVDVSYEGRQLAIRPIRDELAPLPVVLARPAKTQLTRRAAVFADFCARSLAGPVRPADRPLRTELSPVAPPRARPRPA